MRMDKLTNSLQNALADAQSLAVGRDHNQIDSAHLLQALLDQQGGSARPLLQRGGANLDALQQKLRAVIDGLPVVQNATGEVHVSPDLGKVLNLSDRLKARITRDMARARRECEQSGNAARKRAMRSGPTRQATASFPARSCSRRSSKPAVP